MSDTRQIPATEAPPSHVDLVGDVLRKERITKRIALETIARDLKLNVSYIKSLEANEYNNLPADPYIRVYLRSMAKYLALDSEEILKRFYKERGLITEEDPSERPTVKLDVSMNTHQKKPGVPVPVVAGLVVGLLIVGLLANRMGHAPASAPAISTADSTRAAVTAADTMADSIPEKRPDSLDVDSIAGLAASSVPAATAAPAAHPDTVATVKKDSVTLVVRAVTDSVWLQVFCDGKAWKNTLAKGESRTFKARDSLNAHVGNTAAASFTFNGKQVKDLLGGGIVTFKADSKGIVQWPLTQWMTVFKSRIH